MYVWPRVLQVKKTKRRNISSCFLSIISLFRKSAEHRRQFSHPGDKDKEEDEDDEEEEEEADNQFSIY